MPRTAPPYRSTQPSRLRGTSSQKACSAQRGTSDESTRKLRTLDGFPLAFTVCALTALTYALQSYWPVLGLLCLLVVTIPMGER